MSALVAMPDGTMVPPEKATVPLLDRSFLFGDSVYETMRTYGGRPFAAREHLDRMDASMARLALKLPMSREQILERMRATLEAAKNPESYIRLIVSRGVGAFGLAAGLDNSGVLYVIVRPFQPMPDEAYKQGLSIIVAKVRRNPREALDPAIKSGNYLNSIQAMIEARAAGADDAVMLNMEGYLTEATTSSLFIVRDGMIFTPPLSAGILDGITRRYALKAAAAGGFTARDEEDVALDDLVGADEVFLTSTLKEVVPVRVIDRRPLRAVAPGPITRKMRELVSKTILAAHASSPAATGS